MPATEQRPQLAQAPAREGPPRRLLPGASSEEATQISSTCSHRLGLGARPGIERRDRDLAVLPRVGSNVAGPGMQADDLLELIAAGLELRGGPRRGRRPARSHPKALWTMPGVSENSAANRRLPALTVAGRGWIVEQQEVAPVVERGSAASARRGSRRGARAPGPGGSTWRSVAHTSEPAATHRRRGRRLRGHRPRSSTTWSPYAARGGDRVDVEVVALSRDSAAARSPDCRIRS